MNATALEPVQFSSEKIRIGKTPSGDGYRLETAQFLPSARDRVFAFFSDACKLEVLTPRWLRFYVLTATPIHLEVDTLIDYRLRLHGLPMRWRSRISVWEPPFRFVDEQVIGPFRRWHHEHRFEQVDGGTLCFDTVDYAPPGGRLIDTMFVRRDLLRIFRYRQERLGELFGNGSAS